MSRRGGTLLALAALLAVLCAVSLMVGRAQVPIQAWFDPGDPLRVILVELRWPRMLLGVIVGAALGMSGAAMQGYTRNALADPGILGVSSLAALGAVATLYLGAAGQAPWILPAAAMLGAAGGVALLFGLAGGRSSMVTFVLAGVIVNTVAGAGVALALNLAPDPWAVSQIVDWLMGSLADRSLADVAITGPLAAAGMLILMTLRDPLDALTLGETSARSLGVSLPRVRLLLALGVGLATGGVVATTGVVGFVGLVAPHLLRPLAGARPGGLLVPSALAGAVIVLAADILVRLTPAASEVKLGVAMAIIGGPFFLALLVSRRRSLA